MKAIERLKDSKPVPACSKRGIQRLIFQSLICNLLISHLFILPAFAVEVAPHISDREIIEKLSALDTKIDREIANVRGDIKELKVGQIALQQRFDDVNKRIDDTNKRIDELKEGQKVVEGRIDTLKMLLQLTPVIYRVFSNLKTWLNGTHHGVYPKYLQSYLDEFTFRFNRRQTPMAAFQTLLGISTQKSPLTIKTLSNRSQL